MSDRRSLSSSDDANPPPSPPPTTDEAREWRRKRKMIVYDEEDEEKEGDQASSPLNNDEEEDEDDNEEVGDDAKPIGNVVRVSWKGKSRRNHFKGFEADGISYELEDTVLVSPEEYSMNLRPSVAIIRDITATEDGFVTVTGRRFYWPHMAEKEPGGTWESSEARELFYSFNKSEFRADNVMHKCRVHFIPPNKKIPSSKEHPGFIVRKIYDAKSKKLSELLDNDYEDFRKREIDVLVQKTVTRIPDWEEEIRSGAKEAMSSRKTV
ncbi:uncharacterized protein LOC112529564 [Cynara cardunculus var. scolymus]|uniref:Bromo adjacent homology (BAH) domain-containing protein n=1 Tax=Cynara cardunculus var. scolymus TaxID=59895 RepID=A0A124SBV9_CYNCS|nr:uncharacterized protein LOC112529564 [Cynara cardunculus var. scolymus]KVH91870.1 Bromo adjacent homology (BAH) domain-containing protein [Cynara cardunculus var. scolymus]